MESTAGRVKRRGNTRGETLVETIVAFSVLLLMLAFITTIVRSAIQLNIHAQESSVLLDEACTKAEADSGEAVGNPSELTISFPGTLYPDIDVPIQHKKADNLQYFTGE